MEKFAGLGISIIFLLALGCSSSEVKKTEANAQLTPQNTKCQGPFDDNGKKTGLWTCAYETGQKHFELNYKDGKKDGHVDMWNIDGSKNFTSEWKAGWLDGKMVHFYADGKRQIESNYKSGHLEGLSQEWNKKGILTTEEYYKDGMLSGVASEFYEDGTRKSVAHYLEGRMHGDYEEWWPNGKLKAKGAFNLDEKIDKWVYYDSNGNKLTEDQFIKLGEKKSLKKTTKPASEDVTE